MKTYTRLILLTSVQLLTSTAAQAQFTWSADFNNGLTPSGMLLRGNATLAGSAGVGGTPCLSLTPATQGMEGDVILPRFWGEGQTPAEVALRFSVKMSGNGGGVIGDGFSVSVTDGIPAQLVHEGGIGMGPKLCFDTFDNDGTDGGVSSWWPEGRSRYAPSGPPNRLSSLMTNRNDWYSIEYRAQLWSRASLMKFNGSQLVSTPENANATPIRYTNGCIVMGARTGDAFSAHLVDNMTVTVTPYPVFIEQPRSVQITSGTTPAFFAQTNFNTLPWQGVSTYTLALSAVTEWQIQHPGGAWTTVPDSSLPVLWGPDARPQLIFNNVREDQGLWDGDDPALSIDGTKVRCVLSWHNGYSTVTNEATLRLMTRPEEAPGAITLFNSFPLGDAAVTFPHEEGKVLRLTPAQPDKLGGFVFDEMRRTASQQPQQVTALAASFQYRGQQATDPRADGISFNVASDLPDTLPAGAGEEGAGSGLRVCFDAFENGVGDPAGIDILWQNQLVARVLLPAEQLFSDDWVDAFIRVEADGTFDLALNGNAVIFDAPLPGWSGIREPRMAFYGRTGSLWQQQDVRWNALSFTASPLPGALPVLHVQREPDNVLRLTWPLAGSDGWVLQESSDLQTWIPTRANIYVTGPNKSAYMLIEDSRLFFRLARLSN